MDWSALGQLMLHALVVSFLAGVFCAVLGVFGGGPRD